MKKLLFIAAIALISTNLSAQNKGVNHFEVGAGYAPFYLSHGDDALNKKFEVLTYFEWRHEAGKHFDYGARLDYKIGESTGMSKVNKSGDGAYKNYQGVTHFIGALAVAEYRILPDRKVNPYIGIGAGPALEVNVLKESDPRTEFLVTTSPWIGLELFQHIRISAGLNFPVTNLHGEYMPVWFCLGWTF